MPALGTYDAEMRISVLPTAFAVFATSLVGITLGSAPAAAAPPSNDLFANATLITGESGSITGTTADATRSVGEPDGYDPGNTDPDFTNTVWYRITTPDDVGLVFSVPFGRSGISIGTYASYNGGEIYRQFDDYNAGGWSYEVTPGVYQAVAAYAGTFVTDTSQDGPVNTTTYYVRVVTTAADAGPFTLNWSEAGLPTSTTATATPDHAAGTFRIDPATTCTRSFYSGQPPTPMDPATSGYYIVRDESGEVVGTQRRWDFYNPDGNTPAEITDLPLLPGSHTYTVRYYFGSSAAYCARSQAQVTVVGKYATTTQLRAPTTAKVGDRPRVRARVLVGSEPAQGKVVLRVNGRKLATRALVDGAASVRLPELRRGETTVTATYKATASNASSRASRVITVTRR